ncbi:hypothetical protein [Novosphingobium rosa]|uniref:hypothetical protein n=1 Tax=Novosphingobium rosa TaxID=76978 RepID=UPI0014718F38|nr:hypothetical protein [Novosphingobium rosa]
MDFIITVWSILLDWPCAKMRGAFPPTYRPAAEPKLMEHQLRAAFRAVNAWGDSLFAPPCQWREVLFENRAEEPAPLRKQAKPVSQKRLTGSRCSSG